FSSAGAHRALHSFPTRRSSDLSATLHHHDVGGGAKLIRRPCGVVAARRQDEPIGGGGPIDHDVGLAVAVIVARGGDVRTGAPRVDRKSTRLNSSHDQISYAVFC